MQPDMMSQALGLHEGVQEIVQAFISCAVKPVALVATYAELWHAVALHAILSSQPHTKALRSILQLPCRLMSNMPA